MNDKVKAIFFAQYYGQNVAWCKNSADDYQLFRVLSNTLVDEVDYLLLRSINDLSDIEIKHVADVIDFIPIDEMVVDRHKDYLMVYSKCHEQPTFSHIAIYYSGDMFIWDNAKATLIDTQRTFMIKNILLSYGVILPFTFLNDQNQPETYSVENLCELGWVMIKTNN